jgi:TPR repeat protein
MYRQGIGVVQNYAVAAWWIRKAADQGDAAAQTSLGEMYLGGLGVARNNAEAAKWYGKAADQGDASAENHLGVLGVGVTPVGLVPIPRRARNVRPRSGGRT